MLAEPSQEGQPVDKVMNLLAAPSSSAGLAQASEEVKLIVQMKVMNPWAVPSQKGQPDQIM